MGEGQTVVERLEGWLMHPFKSDMSVMDWVLFLGLIVIAVFLWTRVMSHVTKGVENV